MRQVEQVDILQITPISLPFDINDKILSCIDDQGNIIETPYSYLDGLNEIKNMSGINPELLGPYETI